MAWKNVQYQNGKMRTSEGGGGGSTHDYSTTEQVVGTWIDGKPLYEKVIVKNNIEIQADVTIAHNISNIELVIDLKAFMKNSA